MFTNSNFLTILIPLLKKYIVFSLYTLHTRNTPPGLVRSAYSHKPRRNLNYNLFDVDFKNGRRKIIPLYIKRLDENILQKFN